MLKTMSFGKRIGRLIIKMARQEVVFVIASWEALTSIILPFIVKENKKNIEQNNKANFFCESKKKTVFGFTYGKNVEKIKDEKE